MCYAFLLFCKFFLQAISFGIDLIDENGLIQLIKEHSENMFKDYEEEQARKSSSDQVLFFA